MDLLVEALGALLAGLGTVLASLAALASGRYHDSRLAYLAGAFASLAALGGAAFFGSISPRYGGPFQVDPLPLGLALIAAALAYLAMVRAPRPAAGT